MARSHFSTWLAFEKGRKLATSIYNLSKTFPKEEKYGLTDQIRRSSRSVCSNLAESFAKRRYPKHFIAKITDSAGENYETQTWLMFALDHGYVSKEHFDQYTAASERVGRLLSHMEKHYSQYTIPSESRGTTRPPTTRP
jgi:four helix bundle protein